MKQVLQNLRSGQTLVEDVPVPVPQAGFALVRTAASLVSAGTERMVAEFAEKSLLEKARSRPDLLRQVLDKARRDGPLAAIQSAFARLDQPLALGYSSAGTIAALGADMSNFKVGDRVACAGGGYAVHAEYAVVPRTLLTVLPDHVDFEAGAFTTLGAIGLHGFRLAETQLGENVAVIGLGLVGLLTAQIATAAGCRVLGIDLDASRVGLAASLGLEAVARDRAEEAALAFTADRGFDALIICADTTSNDPVELAGSIARDRAHVVAVGAVGQDLPRKLYYEKELSFVNSRSYGPGRYDPGYEEHGRDYPIGHVRWTEGRNFEAVLELISAGKLKTAPLITHRFPIEEAARAYDLITGKAGEAFLGVLLTYPTEVVATPSPRIFLRPPRTTPAATRASSLSARNLRVGVIGAGNFANATLLPALQKVPGLDLIGIASLGGLHAQHTAKKFGFRYAAADVEQILNDPDIDAVAILTRHDSHAEFAVKVLQAGKHAFVEKPLAINREQLDAVARQLSTAEGQLTVGFNRRFAPLGVKLHDYFAGRGEPMYLHYRVNAGYLPPTHWTNEPAIGGGRIVGEACHFIDLITWLVGAVPTHVQARALPDGGRYSQDNVSMTFEFPDGSLGVVDYLANGDRAHSKERLEVFCGGKVAVLDDFKRLELVEAGRKKSERGAGDKGWRSEWVAFTTSIREGSAPPIPYEHLIGVTSATFAAIESLRNAARVEIS